jgi:hypothetical protein
MNHFFRIIIVAVIFLVVAQNELIAQVSVRETQERNRENKFINKLWYGGSLTLNFVTLNNESIFLFGLSPMIGYKIFEQFSIGPRVSIIYARYKLRIPGDVYTDNAIAWTAGIFSRYKIINGIFAHGEFEYADFPVFDYNTASVFRAGISRYYVGAGYNNTSGKVGFEILALYNLSLPEDDLSSPPITFRGGVTYNF